MATTTTSHTHLASRLSALMEARGVSRAELARSTGLAPAKIRGVLQGKVARLPARELAAIAEALDVELELGAADELESRQRETKGELPRELDAAIQTFTSQWRHATEALTSPAALGEEEPSKIAEVRARAVGQVVGMVAELFVLALEGGGEEREALLGELDLALAAVGRGARAFAEPSCATSEAL